MSPIKLELEKKVLKDSIMNHMYILGTIFLGLYGQVVLKWRIGQLGSLPDAGKEKIVFLFQLLLDPIIFSTMLSAFIGALFWMMAMTKFDMSYAYPFLGLAYVLNFLFAVVILNEPFTWNKLIGNFVILCGIIIASRTV